MIGLPHFQINAEFYFKKEIESFERFPFGNFLSCIVIGASGASSVGKKEAFIALRFDTEHVDAQFEFGRVGNQKA